MLLIYKAYTLVPVRLTTSALTGAAILAAYIGCEWLALERGWSPSGGLGSTSVHHYGGFGPDGAANGSSNHSLPERATQKVFERPSNATSPSMNVVGYEEHSMNSDARNTPADHTTAIRVVSMSFMFGIHFGSILFRVLT